MILSVLRTELLETLKLMHTILDRGTKMPILKQVLVSTELSHITLSATDLELGLHRTLSVGIHPRDHEPSVQWTVG